MGVPASHVAFAYALLHPGLASVVFGATTPQQVVENVGAIDTFTTLDDGQMDAVRQLAEPKRTGARPAP